MCSDRAGWQVGLGKRSLEHLFDIGGLAHLFVIAFVLGYRACATQIASGLIFGVPSGSPRG
jgi:hypothetical protein